MNPVDGWGILGCERLYSFLIRISGTQNIWCLSHTQRHIHIHIHMCMHTHKIMAVSWWKGQGPGGSSRHEAGCLSSLNMALEFWEGPRELPVFNPCWNQEEEGSNTVKKCLKIAWIFQWAWKQANRNHRLPSSVSFYVDCPQKVWTRFRVSFDLREPRFRVGLLSQITQPRKFPHRFTQFLGF